MKPAEPSIPERVRVPTIRWPGPVLWGGIAAFLGAVPMGVFAISHGNLALPVLLLLLVPIACLFTASMLIDSRNRLRSLQRRAAEFDVQLVSVPPYPRVTDISESVDDDVAMEIIAREAGEFKKYTESSPFHTFSPMFGMNGRVLVGKGPKLPRETWICVGSGVGPRDVSAMFGAAVPAKMPSSSGVFVEPRKLSRARNEAENEVILPDPEFAKHWRVQCDDPESALESLTQAARLVIMQDVSETQRFWSLELAPQRGSWIWFQDWMIYRRAGYPSVKHLLALAEWINEVADIFEAEQREHAPSTTQ